MTSSDTSTLDRDLARGSLERVQDDRRLMGAAILVVDDDELDAAWSEAILVEASHHVDVLTDPTVVLDTIRAHPPDLVLLDAMMPGLDGVELCRRLQRDPDLAEVPVVFLTADDSSRLHLEALSAGAVDLLVKPVDPAVLAARLDARLHQARERQSSRRREQEQTDELESYGRLLDRRNTELAALLDALPVAAWSTDAHGELVGVNLAFAALVGHAHGGLSGRQLHEVVDPELVPELQELHHRALRFGEAVSATLELTVPEGPTRRFDVTITPLMAGLSAELLGTAQEVTAYHELIDRLSQTADDLRRVQRIGGLGSWTIDLASGELTWSEQVHRLLGVDRDEPVSFERFLAQVHPQDRERVVTAWDGAIESRRYDVEHRVVVGGEVRWFRSSAEFTEDAAGELVRVDGTMLEVTEAHQRSDQMAAERARLRSVLDTVGAIAFEWDPTSRRAVLHHGSHLLEDPPTGTEKVGTRWLSSRVHPEDRERITGSWLALQRRSGQPDLELECRVRIAGDRWHWHRIFLRVIDHGNGHRTVFGVAIDIHEARRRDQALEDAERVDALTGLASRSRLLDELGELLAAAEQDGSVIRLAYLDPDGSARLNVRFGRARGDQLLQRVASCLEALDGDVHLAARLGGDEFAVVAVDRDPSSQATERFVARLRACVGGAADDLDPPAELTASIGIAISTPSHRVGNPAWLLRQAEAARTAAKRRGADSVTVFDHVREDAERRHLSAMSEIEQAWQRREFRVWYQPQVSLDDGQLLGFEALLRWQHPERGLLAPAAFLDALDRSPWSVDVGMWVIDQAVAQLSRWVAQGWDIAVSANLGDAQLADPRLDERVAAVLAAHPSVRPGQLELELLETANLTDIASIAALVGRLHGLGVRVALDDFGVAWSSLSLLHRLEVDTVKIDRSFVRHLPDDESSRAVVATIVELCQRFGTDVVAEGVETEEHVQVLQALGCRRAQGYGIARPMPADEVTSWADRWVVAPPW